jgi:hypothetical protein
MCFIWKEKKNSCHFYVFFFSRYTYFTFNILFYFENWYKYSFSYEVYKFQMKDRIWDGWSILHHILLEHTIWLWSFFLFRFLKAGIPDGVINVVPGFGPTAGAAVSAHMDIDAVIYLSNIFFNHVNSVSRSLKKKYIVENCSQM